MGHPGLPSGRTGGSRFGHTRRRNCRPTSWVPTRNKLEDGCTGRQRVWWGVGKLGPNAVSMTTRTSEVTLISFMESNSTWLPANGPATPRMTFDDAVAPTHPHPHDVDKLRVRREESAHGFSIFVVKGICECLDDRSGICKSRHFGSLFRLSLKVQNPNESLRDSIDPRREPHFTRNRERLRRCSRSRTARRRRLMSGALYSSVA